MKKLFLLSISILVSVLFSFSQICQVNSITLGNQDICDTLNNSYSQEIIIDYSDAPATGQLSVNGENFNITTSPQTIVLTGLVSDGNPVDVTTFFTDDIGCELSENALFVAPLPCVCTSINFTITTVADTCSQNTGCIEISDIDGGILPYTFHLDGVGTNSTGEFCNLSANSYILTIEDSNVCDTTLVINIDSFTYNLDITLTTQNITDCLNPNGTIEANVSGGEAPYEYEWNTSLFGNVSNISNLLAGTYSVVVTDNNGCNGVADTSINNGINVAVKSVKNVKCFGGTNGEIVINTIGGTPPFNYIWSDEGVSSSDSSRSNLPAGSYTIEVRDSEDCAVVSSIIEISEPNQLLVDLVNKQNVRCLGASNGSISMNVSGGTTPYNYSWVGSSANTLNLNAIPIGDYRLQVTDNNNCTASGSLINITEPATIVEVELVSGSVQDISCNGLSDGSFEVTASGGTPPYLFNNGGSNQTSGIFTNLIGGDYTVSVIDSNLCTSQILVTVNVPNKISASFHGFISPSSTSASDGQLSVLNVVGGVAPYSYFWSPSNENDVTATQLSVGINTVTITDINGCEFNKDVNISFVSSIQNLQIEKLKLYPVPASDRLTIDFETIEKEITLSIVSALGSTMFTKIYQTNGANFNETLDISNLSSGIYFIQFAVNNKSASIPFTVNR